MWRNASEEERAPYVAKEKEEREAYKVKRDAWQEEHDEKLEEQNKIQAEQANEQAQAQAAMMYNNSQQETQPNVANQYSYADPISPIGYNLNMQRQRDLEQQYAGQQQYAGHQQQQQQQASQFYNYSFRTQGYACKSFVDDFYIVVSYRMCLMFHVYS